MRWTFLPLLMGCTAARGTIQMVEAEQDYSLAQAAEAEDLAIYAWTMAEAYMHKSREEYGHADYQAAAELAAKASSWSVKAKSIAEGMDINPLEEAPNIVPENLQRAPSDAPAIRNAEDDLVIPGEAPAPEEDPAEGLDLEEGGEGSDDLDTDFLDEDDEEEGVWE